MKRLSIAITLLLIALAVRAYSADITIGAALSTTGPIAAVGIEYKNSVLLAPSTIAGHKVRYVILDDGSDPTKVVQNVKRMISEDNIDALIGPTGTPLTMAALNTIAEAKLPMLSLGSASAIVAPMDEKRRWAFKVVAGEDVMVDFMLRHMVKAGMKTLSIIAIEDPYGESYVGAAHKLAPSRGIRVVTTERFQRTDTSATAQALRVMQGNPDAVLIVALGSVAVTPHRALIERGYKGKIYQSGGSATPDFLRVGGKAVEGSYVVQSPFLVSEQLPEGYPTKRPATEFEKVYEKKYGSRSFFGAQAWDALSLLTSAIPVALKTAEPGTPKFREALRAALEQSRGVRGATAVFTMSATDHCGINELGVSVMKIENGKWKLDQAAAFK